MKRKYEGLGVCAVLLCMSFSKFIRVDYGVNGQIELMIGILLVGLMIIFYLLLKKYYLGAICIICFLMPLVVGAVGIYLDNLHLIVSGLALFFIVGAIVIKVLTKYVENRK